MTREEQAIEYIKRYRKLDEDLYNTAPKGTVASNAAKKCLEFWDMAIKALEQQPCDNAIDRDFMFKVLDNFCGHDRTATITLDTLADLVYELPPVTPQQKIGRWIYTGDYLTEGMLKCSECGEEIDVSESYYDFCPVCGAKMEESEDKE